MLASNIAHSRSADFLAKALIHIAFVLLAAFAGRSALAQGLGELTLESGLNEPFRASIELLNVAGLDPAQVDVRIATPAEYEQAGLDYNALLARISTNISIPASGNGVLFLGSTDRVAEPFLTLLISARWPAGRVMREYTVLLDLPGNRLAPAASLPVSQPRAAAPAPAPRNNAAPAAAPDLAGAANYTVASGDNLWTIAERTRPSADVPVPQMMVAIQRANEAAFVNNDINRLLSGRVLRIPDRREIATVDAAQALALVNAGTTASRTLGLPGASGSAGVQRDELSLLTDDDAALDAGSTDLEATIAALENALLLSEEELDRARLENAELSAQLGELQEQIAILQNIIAIEDDRLAGLQSQLSEQAEATAAARQASQQATQTLASQQAPAGGGGLVDTILALLGNNLIALGGGLVVVLALVGLLVRRARQSRMEDDEDELEFDDEDDDADDDTADRYFDDENALAKPAYGFDQDHEPLSTATDVQESDAGADEAGDDDDYAFSVDADDEDDSGSWLRDEAEEVSPAASGQNETVAASVTEEDNSYATAEANSYGESALAGSSFSDVDDVDGDVLNLDDDFATTEAAGETLGSFTEVAAAPLAASDEVEAFEFRLDTADGPETSAVAEAPAAPAELESFEFRLDTAATPAAATAAPAAVEENLETVAFTPSASFSVDPAPADSDSTATDADSSFDLGTDLDLGNFTFDESDISFEDEVADAGDYTPRTNMDECDTKLDLAVAYEAMGDVEGAREILDEVIAEGKPEQIAEAQRLKNEWLGA